MTYLEASRNNKFKKHVYYGIVIAIAATAVTWFIAQFIIEISGASRELIEAIAGISAVAVLFWVSFLGIEQDRNKALDRIRKGQSLEGNSYGQHNGFCDALLLYCI